MNEHAGMGCVLSGLIVVVFAVVFHEKARPTPVKTLPRPAQAQANPEPSGQTAVPVLPTLPALPPTQVVVVETPSPLPSPMPTPRPDVRPLVKAVASTASISLVSIKPDLTEPIRARPSAAPTITTPARPLAPHSSITIIARGERLVDVAIRVYGSAEATIKLWRANRDRLLSVDDPVSEGWMLRTP